MMEGHRPAKRPRLDDVALPQGRLDSNDDSSAPMDIIVHSAGQGDDAGNAGAGCDGTPASGAIVGESSGSSQSSNSEAKTPYEDVVQELISSGTGLHRGLLRADPNETSQEEDGAAEVSTLKTMLCDIVFMADQMEDYRGTDAGSRKTSIDALVLRLRQLTSFEKIESWWEEVKKKAKELGVYSKKKQEWSKVKKDLCKSVDLARLRDEAMEALDALVERWREWEDAEQVKSLKGLTVPLRKAMEKKALGVGDLHRWDALVDKITTAVVDDVDEDDDAAAKKNKTKQQKELAAFRQLVQNVAKGGTVSAAKRLQAALTFQSATILLGAKDDTEGDTSEAKRPTRASNNELTFAIAALACDAATRRALREAGDWDGFRHQIWWSALRNPNGRGDDFKRKWFSSILNLIKTELPESEFPSVHGLLRKQEGDINNLHRRVTDVVGGAKELLDARLLKDYEWCCSDGTYRRITRIVMSNYAQLPTLETWKNLSGDHTWAYDPYGKFVGESIVHGDDPTLESIMIKEMDKDAYHETDLCCFLETDGDCPDGPGRALLLVQNKFTSRHDARWGEGHGRNLVNYATTLPETIQAKFKLDDVLVDAVWSTTSVFAPPPFGPNVWSHSIVEKYMAQKKNFSALTSGSFGVLFGTKDAFEGASGVAPLRGEGTADRRDDGAGPSSASAFLPRDMQERAIKALVDDKTGVLAGKPCQAVLPCGFGKTFVSYRVAREIFLQRHLIKNLSDPRLAEAGTGKGKRIKLVVFVTPLQRLCHQALVDWRRYDAAEPVFGRSNLVAATSTDPAGILHKSPQEIGAWVKDRLDNTNWEDAASRPLAVFICYHSLESLKEVCASYEDDVFLVCDEAHVAAGPITEGAKDAEDAEGDGKAGNFTGVHTFPSTYRLYQTATPKVHPQNVGEYEEGVKNGIGFVAGDPGGGRHKATYDRKTFACQNDPNGPFGRVAFHATWSECIEQGLLARPVLRLLDASGLRGLSDEERRVFSNYRVSLTAENAHRLLGLDDCDQEKAAGREEAGTRARLCDNKLRAGDAYLGQKKTVDELQKAWDTLKQETKDFRTPRRMSDEQKEKKRAEADAKKALTEATRELLRLGKAYRAACSKLDRLVTSQTSVRLFEFLANMLHAIATCPSARSTEERERAEHVSHVVSYHTTVARAIHVMGLCHFVAAALINDYHAKAQKAQDDGDDDEKARCEEACRRLAELKLGVVSCYQSPQEQEAVIQRFASGECGIIFNVGIMRIGQNVPQINGVAFTDPMSTADAIIQSIGRGLRLFGPEGKQCHVFLPVYGTGVDGGGGDDGVDGVDDNAALQEILLKPEELLVQGFLASLSQSEIEKLKGIDDKFERASEFARRMTEAMGGYGPQDRQAIGALYNLVESTGKGKKKNTLGILNPGTIRADVERRRDDGKRKVAGEENRTMEDVLRAQGSGEASTQADERDPVLELCMMAMVRCATRTFSGTTRYDMTWMVRWKALKAYLVENNGKYPERRDALGLHQWIVVQRMAFNKPENDSRRLSAERIELLERLPGWTWNVYDALWQSKFEALQRHLVANNGEYPVWGDALGLYKWIADQRRAYNKPKDDPARLSAERIELLEELLGWTWNGSNDARWQSKFEALKACLDANGKYPVRGDALGLGQWIHRQRAAYNKPKDDPARLSPERIELLKRLPGWTWRGRFKRPTCNRIIRDSPVPGSFPHANPSPPSEVEQSAADSDDDWYLDLDDPDADAVPWWPLDDAPYPPPAT
jgi:hypothetical protein